MINYKSFKLPGNAKLRVRADQIVATVSSRASGTTDIYVSGVATPWHVKLDSNEEIVKTIDYIWERDKTEEDED